ncbi:MAG: TonB-dependent receptor plug domain-containing protein [Phascolarctobacterium sp.]
MKKFLSKRLSTMVLSSVLALGLCGSVWAEETALNEAGDMDALNSEMEFTLDTMIVTAGRIPTKITDAKADVSVVTRKEIEQMHMTNVEEALRTVPGVQFLNYGSTGLNANVSSLRINGSKEVVVLVDGVRVSDFQGSKSGSTYASLMNNMDNIERIEVVRGSAGAMYGSAAKGGVINIITRKINDTKTTIDISGGSFGKEHYKFNTMGRKDKLSFNVFYDKLLSGDFEDGSGKKWDSSLNSKSLGGKVSYDIKDDHQVEFGFENSKADFKGYDFVYTNDYKGNYENQSMTLKDTIKFSDKWNNNFTYRHTKSEGVYYQNSILTPGTDVDYSYDFISDQATFTTSRHTLVFGFDYSRGQDNNSRTISATGQKVNLEIKNMSYYVQDDWKIIPKVTLSGGIRYDKPDSNLGGGTELDTHTSKSYKMSWDITDNDSIYAGRSDFYILPSMDNLVGQFGNTNVLPSYGRNTTIGYNKKFDENNIFTLNWFETKSERIIGYNYGTGIAQNYNNGISRGWNAQFMTQIGEHWNINLGWAHLFQYADKDSEGSSDTFSMGYYPKDMATFGIFYDYAKFKAGLDGYYFMRRKNHEVVDSENGWPADNYAVINLSATYKPTKNISFYAKVDNLFDKLYAEHTDVIWNHNPGSWYSMPGRSFVVGMQYTF